MFITSQKEIYSIMPTAKWSRPERLYGWIQEEEEANLIPLLGQPLYEELLADYKRLVGQYGDITAMSIRPDGTLIGGEAEGFITPRTDNLGNDEEDDGDENDAELQGTETAETGEGGDEGAEAENTEAGGTESAVSEDDMARIGLIRLCQQIEFYEMLGHKMGLLVTSFNEGGVNRVSANNYDTAEDKDVERAAKDAFMSAKRSTDTLLLTLERDARSQRRFTKKWKEAEYFYMRKDLLFTTARTMQEYYNLGGSREKYIGLLKDIRFCQNVYIKPRVGAKFLGAVLEAMLGSEGAGQTDADAPDTVGTEATGEAAAGTGAQAAMDKTVLAETVDLLRQALALFVEARQNAKTRNVMSAMMADAEQAMSTATAFISENQGAYGSAIEGSPLYTDTEEADKEATMREALRRDPDRLNKARGRRRIGDGRDSAIFTFPTGGTVEPWA